jgi:hypothetical protein
MASRPRIVVPASIIVALGAWLLLPLTAFGQAAPAETATATAEPDTFGWRNHAIVGMNFNQASFSNWQAGGSSNIAWAWTLNSVFEKVQPKYIWRNTGLLEYGFVKQEDDDLRKSIDLVAVETLYTRRVEFYLKPYVSASARTQLSHGRDYDEKTGSSNGVPIFPVTSDFADPLYLGQSAGLGYILIPGIMTTRFGFSVRETITDTFRGYAINDDEEDNGLEFDDCTGNPACDRYKIETGAESITEYARKLDEDSAFSSRLGLFYAFQQPDELDMSWRNDLTIQTLGFLNVNFGLEFLFDQDVINKLQVKQLLGVGVSYNLL